MRETLAMPVLVEEPDIQKRVVETGKVAITKQVHEREVLVDGLLCREEVEVMRVPMQRVWTRQSQCVISSEVSEQVSRGTGTVPLSQIESRTDS